MTGYVTAQAAQAHTMDMLRTAERHRQAHAALLDRLDRRWISVLTRRGRSATARALVTNEPCH